jgi:hypothetical protein
MSTGDYDIFDKNYGRSMHDDTVSDGFNAFFKNAKMEDIQSIRNSLKKLVIAYENSKVVMVGASLLIIYEGSDAIESIPSVNLIDFAHSAVLKDDAEKEFSQERHGVLLGLKNVSKIIDSKIT